MADKLIRVGRVSRIDYANGMISVTYPDLDNSTTSLLSVVSFNDEYKMPEIGDDVLVLHLPSGQARGLVLGKYWNSRNKPASCGAGVYRKEFASTPGEAYMEYDPDTGELLIKATSIRFVTDERDISVDDLVEPGGSEQIGEEEEVEP